MDWSIIGYLAALIAAVAFAALVVYVIKVLKQVEITLENVADVTVGLDKQINGITTEATMLLHKTNKLAEGIEEQTEKLSPVVESIEKVGGAIDNINSSIEKVSQSISHELDSNKKGIATVLKWSNAGIQLFKRYKDEEPKTEPINRNLPQPYQTVSK